ncbi:hypothetical protein HOY82DRAFT_604258 [Tuber indicum]|nr:hypothetical protein HOY82DRAFT_604258 [Tuber indicum]
MTMKIKNLKIKTLNNRGRTKVIEIKGLDVAYLANTHSPRSSPVVPLRPPPSDRHLPSPIVTSRPPWSPAIPHRHLPSPTVPYVKLSQTVGLVVLPNDGHPGSLRMGMDYSLPSRLVQRSWQSPRRARWGPQTAENTGLSAVEDRFSHLLKDVHERDVSLRTNFATLKEGDSIFDREVGEHWPEVVIGILVERNVLLAATPHLPSTSDAAPLIPPYHPSAAASHPSTSANTLPRK